MSEQRKMVMLRMKLEPLASTDRISVDVLLDALACATLPEEERAEAVQLGRDRLIARGLATLNTYTDADAMAINAGGMHLIADPRMFDIGYYIDRTALPDVLEAVPHLLPEEVLDQQRDRRVETLLGTAPALPSPEEIAEVSASYGKKRTARGAALHARRAERFRELLDSEAAKAWVLREGDTYVIDATQTEVAEKLIALYPGDFAVQPASVVKLFQNDGQRKDGRTLAEVLCIEVKWPRKGIAEQD